MSSLFLVFSLRNGDILNCRMATLDLSKAEQECLAALRMPGTGSGSASGTWVRIVSIPSSSFVVGDRVWVSLNDNHKDYTDIRSVTVLDQANPHADWVEDLVVV
jgi:hypothetical protein